MKVTAVNPKPQSSRFKGALAGGILAAAVWTSSLVAPHAVYPDALPDPAIDYELATRLVESEKAQTMLPLPYSVRVIGELVRRCGRAEFQGDALQYQSARTELQQAVRQVTDVQAIVALRALQTRLFVQALASSKAQNEPAGAPEEAAAAVVHGENELAELGGSFVKHYAAAIAPESDTSATEWLELAAAYRVRWTELLGPVPGLSSSRVDRAFVLKLRLRRAARLPSPDRGRAELSVLKEIAAVDPDYPTLYAQGIAWTHAGVAENALGAFQSYLEANPSGPYTFRARNFALYSALELSGN